MIRLPQISTLFPYTTLLPANSQIQVRATIDDDTGLASVVMLWMNGGTTTQMPCPASTPNWSCPDSGRTYVRLFAVRSGDCTMQVQATDADGNVATSSHRTIH